MQAIVIKQSQRKMWLVLLVLTTSSAVALWVNEGNILIYFASCGVGLMTIPVIIRLIFPSVLTLSDKGFSISGGLFDNQDFEYWENVSEFYPKDVLASSSKYYAPIITFDRINGDSEGIANCWPYSRTDLIVLLNEYRSNALQPPS